MERFRLAETGTPEQLAVHVTPDNINDLKDYGITSSYAGWTMLHHAVFASNVKNVALLIAQGANIELQTMGGETPLSMTIKLSQSHLTAQLLLNGGAQVREEDILDASTYRQRSIVAMLIECGGAKFIAPSNDPYITSLTESREHCRRAAIIVAGLHMKRGESDLMGGRRVKDILSIVARHVWHTRMEECQWRVSFSSSATVFEQAFGPERVAPRPYQRPKIGDE